MELVRHHWAEDEHCHFLQGQTLQTVLDALLLVVAANLRTWIFTKSVWLVNVGRDCESVLAATYYSTSFVTKW